MGSKWLKVMLFKRILDNSLFSVFLTSFLSHFETSQNKVIYILKKKQIQREKNILRFFSRKINFFLVMLLFSIFFFFCITKPRKYQGRFCTIFSFGIIWEICNLLQRKSSFYILHSLYHRAQKKLRLQRGGGSRTLGRHCICISRTQPFFNSNSNSKQNIFN